MVEIEFTEDFAGRKKGDRWKCDGQLASQLINGDKVAKLAVKEEKKAPETKEHKTAKKTK